MYRIEIEYENGYIQENVENRKELIVVLSSCISQLARRELSAVRLLVEKEEREGEG